MENLDLYNKFRAVPQNAQRPIKGGRMNGKTDINPMWRIKALTEQFGPCGIGWYYIPVRKWLETCGNEIAAFVDIELYVKCGDEWSKPIPGNGGSMFAASEKSGIYVSDECYKMATTDAISVACKQLGIGADIYWGEDKTKYDKAQNPTIELVQAAEINEIAIELSRTGVGMKSLLASYGLSDIHDMTMDQFTDAMRKFKKKPDKPVPSDPEIPKEEKEGLPWYEPER